MLIEQTKGCNEFRVESKPSHTSLDASRNFCSVHKLLWRRNENENPEFRFRTPTVQSFKACTRWFWWSRWCMAIRRSKTRMQTRKTWFRIGFLGCRTHARPKLQSHDALFPRGIRAWNLTFLSRDSGCEAHEHIQMELGPDCWWWNLMLRLQSSIWRTNKNIKIETQNDIEKSNQNTFAWWWFVITTPNIVFAVEQLSCR